MNYTTLEQSKKLIELGLNPETADMIWLEPKRTHITDCPETPSVKDIYLESIIPEDKRIPCWSVGALFQVIPTKIGEKLDYWLTMETTTSCNYVLFYKNIYSNEEVCESSKNENLLDSAIDLIEKLIKEGFLNTKG